MPFDIKLSILLLSIFSLVVACDDDDVIENSNEGGADCIPIHLKSGSDSIVYFYNAAKKLESISSYEATLKSLKGRYDFEYNANGQLTEAIRFVKLGSGLEVLQHFELIYNGQATPQILHTWGAVKTDPPVVTSFHYDASARLIRREQGTGIDPVIVRYEYNDQGNVERIYYKNQTNPEVLGRENLSFDNKTRFYGAMPDLALFYVYIMSYDPSKNNILRSTIYYSDPFNDIVPDHNSIYNLTYNTNGLITKSILSAAAPFSENLFLEVKYQCD